jgi:AbrB family looped-hinge helix DNA binding protein
MNATIDMVTISSKGQIVIPKKILKALGLKEQDKLLIFNKGENILLKRVKPEMFEKSLRDMLLPIRQEAEAKGLTEKDVEIEIKANRVRKSPA